MNKDPVHIKAVGDSLERKYGKRVPAQIPQFFKKMGDTCERLYGVRNCFNLPEVKEKHKSLDSKRRRLESLKATNNQLYGVDWYVQSDDFKAKNKTTNGTSKEEKAIIKWLDENIDEELVVGTFKEIYPFQLDIYIPSKKIAIEFNGVYYHSIEKVNDIFYHLHKTKLCEEKGIQLIHIWEDEWNHDNSNIKSFIKSTIDGTSCISSYLHLRDDGQLYEVDRSKFNKCAIPKQYEIVGETDPEIILRAKTEKDKYKVADCGKLILKLHK